MCNIKNGNVYSDKFTLSVVELKHIDMATDEDKAYNIDTWAALFKATTWEEIKMLAQTDPYIESAAESIYSSVTDPKILELCKKRQEEIRGDIRRRERLIELDKQIAEKDDQIAEKENQIAEKENQIAEKENQIAEKENQIAEKDNQIAEKENQIAEKDNQIAEKDNQIAEKDDRISRLESLLKSKGIEVPD